MAQGGSGRSGGKTRPAGKGAGGGRKPSGSTQRNAAAAQRAIKGARGGGGVWRVLLPIGVVVVVAAAVTVGLLLTRHNNTNNNASSGSGCSSSVAQNIDTSPSVLAPISCQVSGQTVDGVGSNDMEQVLFHVHAHLSMYVNGQPKLLPYGIGIVPPYQLQPMQDGSQFVAGGSKYYWLHTHDESGLIHIESPVQRTYTLGMFFDVYHQPLSASQVGPDKGTVTAFLNGKQYTGDPRNIPLNAHNIIQLDVGTVVPFANYTFPQGV